MLAFPPVSKQVRSQTIMVFKQNICEEQKRNSLCFYYSSHIEYSA